ncbi:(d)CMP kinase [Arcanobacterium urinimassiliense]|uniref:(d)CMP kinase n=1 Tax=Arcanobacterium urinimassiliense TaxID=1871014 RepID=UPI00093C9ADD|nr:(d)CMP kinase [Arcanobacterium urinimassiliense]
MKEEQKTLLRKQLAPDSLVIAIDGPSGSGKSTVAKELAFRHHLAYLDTGAIYRAAAWWAQHQQVDLADTQAVAQVVENMPLQINLDPRQQQFFCAGIDITEAIRTPELTRVVSQVSSNLAVRAILKAKQRQLIEAESGAGNNSAPYAQGRGIVAEGRDITTEVAPDAPVRVLLTASEAARLRRRALEVRGSIDAENLAATRAEVVNRDRKDSKVTKFLQAAPGVYSIDSSNLSVDEVVAEIEKLLPKGKNGGTKLS